MRRRARRLNSRLLPTFGRPTMATTRDMASTPQLADIAINPIARFHQLFISGGETRPDETAAIVAKRSARHDRHRFGFKQAVGKLAVAQPGRGHFGKGVKGAAGGMALEPAGVEAAHDQVAP